jgi:hypothetical protein
MLLEEATSEAIDRLISQQLVDLEVWEKKWLEYYRTLYALESYLQGTGRSSLPDHDILVTEVVTQRVYAQ